MKMYKPSAAETAAARKKELEAEQKKNAKKQQKEEERKKKTDAATKKKADEKVKPPLPLLSAANAALVRATKKRRKDDFKSRRKEHAGALARKASVRAAGIPALRLFVEELRERLRDQRERLRDKPEVLQAPVEMMGETGEVSCVEVGAQSEEEGIQREAQAGGQEGEHTTMRGGGFNPMNAEESNAAGGSSGKRKERDEQEELRLPLTEFGYPLLPPFSMKTGSAAGGKSSTSNTSRPSLRSFRRKLQADQKKRREHPATNDPPQATPVTATEDGENLEVWRKEHGHRMDHTGSDWYSNCRARLSQVCAHGKDRFVI